MNKKLQLILLIVILLIISGGMYLFFSSGKKPVVSKISYLVSAEDSLKYCNGADMDSLGYQKTITVEKTTNLLETDPTKTHLIKTVINAATIGMCNVALSHLNIIEKDGIVYIPPIDAWAGVSITMCSCRPEVEVNLLRLPGITKVVWSEFTGSNGGIDKIKACTMEAKLCPDGSSVGRTGPNCEFAPCSQTNILPYDSGVEGVVTLGPTCPVVRVGDTTCADKPYTTTVQVIAVGSPNSSPLATVKSDDLGYFKIMLPPGDYALQPVGGNVLPRCETKNITVFPSRITKVDLSCDTGIR